MPEPKLGRLLIVDDETELMTTLCETLGKAGFETQGVTSGEEAVDLLPTREFDLLLADIMMPGMNGIELLQKALDIDPNMVGIMMTGHGTIETAVEAMKIGAFDYVLKPFKLSELVPVINRAMEMRRLRLENMQLRETVGIYELTKAMAFSLDSGTILSKFADAVVQQCGGDECSVMLPGPEGDYLYVAAARGKRAAVVLGERIPMGEGIAGWVAANRETLLLHDKTDDPRLGRIKMRPGVLSSVSMPMMAGGKLLGVLNVSDSRRTKPFTLGQVKALSILAGLTASALESAQLYDQLREAELKYRTLVEQLPAIAYVASFNGGHRAIYVSPQVQSLLGFSPDEWLADPNLWTARIHPEERPRVLDHIRQSLSIGAEFVCEYRMLARDHSTLWVHDEGRVISSPDCDPCVVQGIIVNVTALKRQERAARRQATALEQAAEAIVITDQEGRIEYVNPAFTALSGYTREEIIGREAGVLRDRVEDESTFAAVGEALAVGKVWKGRVAGKAKEDRTVQVDLTVSAVRDEMGRVTSYVAIGHDVTEQVELQKQYLQAQKMEAIGTLAGGFAHDFNNLLTVVSGYSELLLSGKEVEDADYEDLRKIALTSQKGVDLVRRLLTFSRKVEAIAGPLNLNAEIEDLKKLLSRTIPKMIEIDLNLAPDLKHVVADSVQIGQLLMNLALNAKDAMPDGGRLVIETANVTLDDEYCRTHVEGKPGDYVLLTVSDTGHGMDKETVGRIFEPFFTTKEPGEGSGLGLATVYGIVKLHGGYITCYSQVGHGTAFRIYLPALETDKIGKDSSSDVELPAGGTETILLVDDEEFVRDLGTRLLTRAGYTVLKATNGQEGLDLYERQGEDISLVVLDLVMPVMGGKQCLEKLLEIDPNVRVVISSGFSVEGRTGRMIESGAKGFVTKPFRSIDFLRKVREVLDGP